MRILIACSYNPFVRSEVCSLAEGLAAWLQEHGHEAGLARIPFGSNPPEKVLDRMLAARLLGLDDAGTEPADVLVGLNFPAYLAGNEKRKVWVCQQYRSAYELWGTALSKIPDDEGGAALRASILEADGRSLTESTDVFAASGRISERLRKAHGKESKVLYPPPLDRDDEKRPEGYGDYLVCPGGIGEAGRQHLAVEALGVLGKGMRLVLAGDVERRDYLESIRRAVEKGGFEDRVEIVEQPGRDELFRLVTGSRAVVNLNAEDHPGCTAIEAFSSGKALVTCVDSGGPLELVRNGETGVICEPEPDSVAEAMSVVMDEKKARALGSRALDLVAGLGLSWERVAEAIVS